jgi:hypothetical protein
MPDVVIAPDSTSELVSEFVQSMLRTGVPFLYVRQIIDSDVSLRADWGDQRAAFIEEYQVDEARWQEFLRFAEENDFRFSDRAADHEAGVFTREEVARARPTLEVVLKARLAQRLYRADAWYPIFNRIDPVVLTALDLWESATTLSAYHMPENQGGQVRGGD